ncbi:MAG TPA: CDP-alcohol phosphatidyltransferase [Galbitalea sp.]|jgi:hypothetical protein|nr:CDP-alcohol phosphatidyltransferase [Galbitalea sp.]
MTREPRRGTPSLVVAIVLMVALPLAPGVIAAGTGLALVRIPIESVVVVIVTAVLPWRVPRIVLAIVFGVFVDIALALAGLSAAFEYALGRPFDPTDTPQISDGYGVVTDSIGGVASVLVLVLLAVIAVAVVLTLAWSALRVDAALRRNRPRGRTITIAVTAAWVVALLAGSQLVAGQPAAASASFQAIASSLGRASTALAEQRNLPEEVKNDPYAKVPSSDLLTSLRGKDVIFAFIESYGQVAVQGTSFSPGVDRVLKQGQSDLAAHGFSDESAWLTSPTFGGLSWLAHSTLQTGLWVNEAPTYSAVIRSNRFTLSDAFAAAGWNTVSDVPSDTVPWSFGKSFYHYGTLLDATNVGYKGPKFGYAQIPDQYTWQYFADHELAGPHQPVMAEIDTVSSHTPWAPLPQLVPRSEVGDGSIYDPQPAESESSDTVWQNSKTVQQFYGQSIQYSLKSLYSFVENSHDPNLVVIALGDHQPATIVSGHGADHEVPITVIAKDPKVFDAISGWNWPAGDRPTSTAPVWAMSAFRNRFLSAFDKK